MSNNLVQNGGFETGDFTGWTVTDPEPSNPDIGVDSQPLDVNSGNFGVFAGNETTTLSQTIATTPGHTYTVSFNLDVYQSAAINGGVTVTFAGQSVANLSEPVETDQFVQYTATISATSATSLLKFTFTDPGGFFGLDDVSVTDNAACYRRGTRLKTPAGEVAIEALRVGAAVLTQSGMERPVKWIGHRAIDTRRHREPAAVWPIRIRRGAFGKNCPSRDLWVSPGHSLYVDGVLIQAEKLLNGATVAQIPQTRVEYWHVELDSHDVLIADGLAAESYLDTGNRAAFANGGAATEAHPDFRPKHWSDTYAPLVFDGEPVRRVRAQLLERARALGYDTTDRDDAHMIVDGRRIEPVRLDDRRIAFDLPAANAIELRCRTFIPAHNDPSSTDTRALGLCVGRIEIDGSEVPLDREADFAQGWHSLECHPENRSHRWTRERLRLPAGTRSVVLELAGRGHYWIAARGENTLSNCGAGGWSLA